MFVRVVLLLVGMWSYSVRCIVIVTDVDVPGANDAVGILLGSGDSWLVSEGSEASTCVSASAAAPSVPKVSRWCEWD